MKERLRKLFQWRKLRRWARMKEEAAEAAARVTNGDWNYAPTRRRYHEPESI